MLVSTTRYAKQNIIHFAQCFSDATGSIYCTRGKKTIEKLAKEARKKGAHALALVSENQIAFISISLEDWKWNEKSLYIIEYKMHETKEKDEIGIILGSDAQLFGFDSYLNGEITINAEKGKLVSSINDTIIFEMKYRVIPNIAIGMKEDLNEKQSRNGFGCANQ